MVAGKFWHRRGLRLMRYREIHCTQDHKTLLRDSLWSCLGIPLAVPGKTPHQNVWVHYPGWGDWRRTQLQFTKDCPHQRNEWVLNEHLQPAQSLTSEGSIRASPRAKHMLSQDLINDWEERKPEINLSLSSIITGLLAKPFKNLDRVKGDSGRGRKLEETD